MPWWGVLLVAMGCFTFGYLVGAVMSIGALADDRASDAPLRAQRRMMDRL
jgi:hypothetical protein